MKNKILGIFVCMLLIATVTPVISVAMEEKINNNETTLNGGWIKKYGGDGIDAFKGLDLTHDDCYIVAGETEIDSNMDAWLVKIDINGEIIWEMTYGTPDGPDGFWPVISTSDGGYLAGGWYYNSTQQSWDALLVKTNHEGNITWAKTYGGEEEEDFWDILEVEDGYFAVGKSFSFSDAYDAYVIKIDFNGNIIWEKTYPQGVSGELSSIIQANENDGYILSGGIHSSTMQSIGRLLKIDEDGNVISDKLYGSLVLQSFYSSVASTLDNKNYIIVSGDAVGPIGLLLKSNVGLILVDNKGEKIWTQHYGVPLLKDYSICVQPTSDGGYIFSGHTFGIGIPFVYDFAAWSKVWLVKTDESGNLQWQNHNLGNGHARTVREIEDGYILCGYEGHNHGINSEYAFLIKTDKNGEI